jgi:hypothetical protein
MMSSGHLLVDHHLTLVKNIKGGIYHPCMFRLCLMLFYGTSSWGPVLRFYVTARTKGYTGPCSTAGADAGGHTLRANTHHLVHLLHTR